jgi:hypothetical protein
MALAVQLRGSLLGPRLELITDVLLREVVAGAVDSFDGCICPGEG